MTDFGSVAAQRRKREQELMGLPMEELAGMRHPGSAHRRRQQGAWSTASARGMQLERARQEAEERAAETEAEQAEGAPEMEEEQEQPRPPRAVSMPDGFHRMIEEQLGDVRPDLDLVYDKHGKPVSVRSTDGPIHPGLAEGVEPHPEYARKSARAQRRDSAVEACVGHVLDRMDRTDAQGVTRPKTPQELAQPRGEEAAFREALGTLVVAARKDFEAYTRAAQGEPLTFEELKVHEAFQRIVETKVNRPEVFDTVLAKLKLPEEIAALATGSKS